MQRQASLKMDVQNRLELNTHLRLVRFAQALAPDKLATAERASLDEALDGLSGQPIFYPKKLKLHMFNLHVQRLQSEALSTLNLSTLQKLWQTVRCYSIGPAQCLDLKAPVLCTLGLESYEACRVFMDAMMIDIILPLVLEGASRVSVISLHLQGSARVAGAGPPRRHRGG